MPILNKQLLVDGCALARENATHNHGITFTPNSLRAFLDSCACYWYWYEGNTLSGIMSLRYDGELGVLLNAKSPRAALRGMKATVRSIDLPMWCRVDEKNRSVIHIALRTGFRLLLVENGKYTFRRN